MVLRYIWKNFSQQFDKMKRSLLLTMASKYDTILKAVEYKADPPQKTQAWKEIGEKLPFENLDNFLEFDESLKTDEKKQNALVDIFQMAAAGCASYEADVPAIMAKLIKKDVQVQYSGCGKKSKGVGKLSFKETETFKIMDKFLTAKYYDSKNNKLKIVSENVFMAHALRRISYATCDPGNSEFSFFAREPKGHFNLQYCHCFTTTTAEQAEELNSIVGNAFRMAYAAQLQKQPTLQDVIASQLDQTQTDKVLWTKDLCVGLKKEKSTLSLNNQQLADMEVHINNSDTSSIRIVPPSTIPGLRPTHKYNVLNSPEKNESQQSTPSSDESNSPTELNSCKKISEKPPLIKRIAMGLTGGLHNADDDNYPLVSCSLPGSTPNSPTNRPIPGYANEIDNENQNRNNANSIKDLESVTANITKHIEIQDNRLLQNSNTSTDQDFKSKRISQISSSSSSSCPQTGTDSTFLGFTPTPPPLPERTDSLSYKEEGELRTAPWFQAGIPREITLEVLGQEPVGAFMVRESTTKSGCYALSLRVPRSFQPSGIAHYLIIRTNKGFKIKGFTKEFTTLTSLITHHSVMPELLPCPLSLSRYNPSFVKSDSRRDFADIDLDPDYNTLADFRKMMADLNI